MINFTQLVLASHNAGKLKELQAMLGGSVQLRSIGEFSQVEPQETGLSFVENAILKARNAARISACRRWPTIPGWPWTSWAARPAFIRPAMPTAKVTRRTMPSCSKPSGRARSQARRAVRVCAGPGTPCR